MKKNAFQIDLDTSVLKKLRNTINRQLNISYNKKYKEYRAWDKICAIMDRLDDTVDYLNTLKLNTGKYRRSAFDFYDFMNNSSVVVDCIKELAEIFKVPKDKIKNATNIFDKTGKDGNGTDEKYVSFKGVQSDFEYYALVHVALYLHCLENKCLINKNIPNSLKYRDRLLSDNEKKILFNLK